MKVTFNLPVMCECGRMYKDRRNKNGKMLCSLCHTGLSKEELKLLWSFPAPERKKDGM